MTRQEEIRNAIDIIFPIPPSEKGRKYEQALMATGFEAGVKWADEHSKSPWISVKDDLPCNHEEKIHKDCLSTTNVFALYSDYSLGLNYMRKINNKWIWHNGEPLYWIDMPNYLPTIENEV